MRQLIWAPLLKIVRYATKLTLINKWSRKECMVAFTLTSHKCLKWAHLFCYEARKNKPQVNYGKQKTTRINYVVLAHENNLDNIHLADDSNEFVHRKDSHKQTFWPFS